MDKVLPESRHDEVDSHLKDCNACTQKSEKLQTTLKALKEIQKSPADFFDVDFNKLHFRPRFFWSSSSYISRASLFTLIPLFACLGVLMSFSTTRAYLEKLNPFVSSPNFVRYNPLQNGILDILEEQSQWVNLKEPWTRSFWEEGGLGPDEFEKSFQMRSNVPVHDIDEPPMGDPTAK